MQSNHDEYLLTLRPHEFLENRFILDEWWKLRFQISVKRTNKCFWQKKIVTDLDPGPPRSSEASTVQVTVVATRD
jgi:hypothetical protein